MKHAREDYNRIQDPENKIPVDEPVFLIRGQDIVGPQIVEMWAIAARKVGAAEDIVGAAFHQAGEMRKWQNMGYRKIPDMPY